MSRKALLGSLGMVAIAAILWIAWPLGEYGSGYQGAPSSAEAVSERVAASSVPTGALLERVSEHNGVARTAAETVAEIKVLHGLVVDWQCALRMPNVAISLELEGGSVLSTVSDVGGAFSVPIPGQSQFVLVSVVAPFQLVGPSKRVLQADAFLSVSVQSPLTVITARVQAEDGTRINGIRLAAAAGDLPSGSTLASADGVSPSAATWLDTSGPGGLVVFHLPIPLEGRIRVRLLGDMPASESYELLRPDEQYGAGCQGNVISVKKIKEVAIKIIVDGGYVGGSLRLVRSHDKSRHGINMDGLPATEHGLDAQRSFEISVNAGEVGQLQLFAMQDGDGSLSDIVDYSWERRQVVVRAEPERTITVEVKGTDGRPVDSVWIDVLSARSVRPDGADWWGSAANARSGVAVGRNATVPILVDRKRADASGIASLRAGRGAVCALRVRGGGRRGLEFVDTSVPRHVMIVQSEAAVRGSLSPELLRELRQKTGLIGRVSLVLRSAADADLLSTVADCNSRGEFAIDGIGEGDWELCVYGATAASPIGRVLGQPLRALTVVREQITELGRIELESK